MAPAKRKASTTADTTGSDANKRQKKAVEPTASSSRPSRTSLTEAAAPRSTRSSVRRKSAPEKPANTVAQAPVNEKAKKSTTKTTKNAKATGSRNRGKQARTTSHEEDATVPQEKSSILVDVPIRDGPAEEAAAEEEADVNGEGPAYWLMKAEPESRIEKGKDVKFSIDDLEAATEPEGWDGM